MEENTRSDLNIIFGGSLREPLMKRSIEHLDGAIRVHPDSLVIKTRNEKNQISEFRGILYFSLVYNLREKPVVAAGAAEENPTSIPVPIMRFRDTNSALASVSTDHTFPYKKLNWT